MNLNWKQNPKKKTIRTAISRLYVPGLTNKYISRLTMLLINYWDHPTLCCVSNQLINRLMRCISRLDCIISSCSSVLRSLKLCLSSRLIRDKNPNTMKIRSQISFIAGNCPYAAILMITIPIWKRSWDYIEKPSFERNKMAPKAVTLIPKLKFDNYPKAKLTTMLPSAHDQKQPSIYGPKRKAAA